MVMNKQNAGCSHFFWVHSVHVCYCVAADLCHPVLFCCSVKQLKIKKTLEHLNETEM